MVTTVSSLERLSAADIAAVCAHRAQTAMTADDWVSLGMAPGELATRCAAIIARNLKSGRAQRVIGKQGIDAPQAADAYVDRVVTAFAREDPRVTRLDAGDREEWQRLFELLFRYARSMLRRYNSQVDSAADFAQLACESICSRPFPYDVTFNAWAGLILKNHIRMKRLRSRDVSDRAPGAVSLDRASHDEAGDDRLHDLLADPSNDSIFERRELREWLLDAIQRLPSREQQDVILLKYFYSASDEAIAQQLDRSVQAVYRLRHRALLGLRSILTIDLVAEPR